MILTEIAYNSPEYQKTLALRERVLRIPLGLKLSDIDTADEDQQLHFAVFDERTLVASVVAKPLGNGAVKLRQMAVCPQQQRKGVGRQLLRLVENTLWQRGFQRIEMSARQSAIGFYEKLGYRTSGESYIEQGIPHIKMQR
ncbi:MAG: GNAT family N-acetyltransferase [Gammaproteobacteria bacterium]|nr:GNAT family N-acetyltransferase [Gammaproteobacteria bacterium]